MKFNFLRVILITIVTILFVACKSSNTPKFINEQNDTVGGVFPKIQSKGKGLANKGPFIKGSIVIAYKLNSDGSRILDKVVTTKTLDDTGIFSIEIPWTGLTELHIEGTYLNELTGQYMNDGNLSSIINMKKDKKNEAGINLLTDISKKIIIGKMEKKPEGNFENFEKEVKEVIVEQFNLDENISFGALDVTKTENVENIQLLELSSIVLGTDDPKAVLDDLVEALSNVDEDGELDAEGNSVVEELQEVDVDLDNVVANLGNNLDGVEIKSNFAKLDGQLGLKSKIRFPRINNALLDTNYTSEIVTINGIIGDVPATLSIDKGWYKINGALPAQKATSIKNGDTLQLIQTSSVNYSTKERMNVKIGKKSIRFVVKTISDKKANDGKPDKFTFGSKRNVPINTVVTSDTKITGINVKANISIDKGEYSINGGEYTSSDGTIQNEDNITVRVKTGSELGQKIVAKVTIGTDKSGTRTGKFVVYTQRKDRTPEISGLFTTISGVEKSTSVISNSIKVTDINVPVRVKIKGAEFSIDGGKFQSKSSIIKNGQTIRVRATSSNNFDTKKEFLLNIGRVVIPFTVITKSNPVTPDGTPDKFKFNSLRTQEASKLIESNVITVSSINQEVTISVTNGEYRINGGDYTSSPSKVKEGDKVQLRVTSADYGSEQIATLNIGGVTASFSVKTIKDETPEPVFFPAKLNVIKDTQIESDKVNIIGINVPIPVTVVSSVGEYSIDGGAYTSVDGTIENNQRLRVRLNSANSANSSSVAVIKVGQMPLTFVTITQEDALKFKTPIVAPPATEDKKYQLELSNFLEEGIATSWSMIGNPSWLTINPINGRLTGTPKGNDTVGSFPITVTAKNDTGESSVTFDLVVGDVNYPPVLATLSNLSKNEDDKPFTLTLSSTDKDGTVGSYSATASNSKVTVSVVDNNLTITPQKNAYGSVDITVTVTDDKGAKDSKTFTLNLASINDAPILNALSPITINEDANPVEVALSSSDVESDKITYSATSSDKSKLTTVVNGSTLKLIPQPNMNGSVIVTVTANDGTDNSKPQTFNVTITPVNDAPLVVLDTVTTLEDKLVVIDVLGNDTDIENDNLTITNLSTPSNGIVSIVDGKVKYTPNENYNGVDTFSYTPNDGTVDGNVVMVTVTVTAVNDVPVLEAIPAKSVNEDSAPFSIELNATDVDGDTITYTATSLDTTKATVSVNGSTLMVTPIANMNGDVNITVTANDGIVNSNVETFVVTINALNDAPTITGTPTTRTMEDMPYSFVPVGADVDTGTTLVYSIVNNPTWAGFDSSTGALTGVPSANDIGTTTGIIISVSDGNLTASLPPFDLEVTHVNHAPIIEGDAPSLIAVGSEYSFTPTASDLDVNDTLTFSVENAPEWLDLNTTSGELSGMPEIKDIGEYADIVLSVTDDMNTSCSMTLSIQVFDDVNITALPISLPINLYSPKISEEYQGGNCTNMYSYVNFFFDTTPREFYKEYDLDINGTFQQRATGYMLNPNNGDWESEAIFGKTIEVNDNFIDVVDENVRFAVTNEVDISNQDVNISGLMVRFPSGAKKYTLNARGYGQRYFIWEPKENYATLDELISATCEQQFITAKESENNSVGLVPVGCTGIETEGLLEEHNSTDTLNSNAGHWVIKTVNNKEMLVIYPSVSGYNKSEDENESLMFTEFDDGSGSKLWEGTETNRDGTQMVFTVFNEMAMNAIRQKMLDAQLGIKFRFTREMLADKNIVWNVYHESNETTGEEFWKGSTLEFTTDRIAVQEDILATVDNPIVDTNYSITDRGQVVFFDSTKNELAYLTIVDMTDSNMTVCESNTSVPTCSEGDFEFVYFNQDDSQNALNANAVLLPDGYVYRVINNKGEEVNTTVEVDGTTYLIKLYANYAETADRQKNHKAVRVTINDVQSDNLRVQSSYVSHNIVAGIYVNKRLMHVSDLTEVTDDPGISIVVDIP